MKKIRTLCFVIAMVVMLNTLTFVTVAQSQQTPTEDEILDTFNNEVLEEAKVASEETVSDDETIHCGATIDDDFADNMIFVFIKKQYSEIKQLYTTEDFPYLELEVVEEGMAYYTGNRVCIELYLQTPGKQNVLDAIALLEQDERVYHAFPNRTITFEVTKNIDSLATANQVNERTISVLSDENTANTRTGTCCVSRYTNSQSENSNAFNNPVKVGIVDTGIYNNIAGISSKVAAYIDFSTNYSGVAGYTIPSDMHGTSMASIIAKSAESSLEHDVCGNYIFAGVCENVQLYSFKVFEISEFTDDKIKYSTPEGALASIINYANANSVKILNMSIEIPINNQGEMAELNTVLDNYNGIVIGSAGNNNLLDIDSDSALYFPRSSTHSKVIVVGGAVYNRATNQAIIGDESNYGDESVDLFAYDTVYGYTSGHVISNGKWVIDTSTIERKTDGSTSNAAARVSGVAAVLLNICPTLTPSQIRRYILAGVDSSSALTNYCVTGGSLNAYKSAKMLISDLAYDGETVFAGHFTTTEMQVVAYCQTGPVQLKAYVWTYENGKFSDPVHWFTHNSYCLSANKYRSVCGDFDDNGYDEICTYYDSNNNLFVRGNGYRAQAYYSTLPYTGFTGRLVALDYNGDGKDEIAGIYDTGTWGHTQIYLWQFTGSGTNMTATQTCIYDSGAGNYEADYVTGRVVAGNFDGDYFGKEEIAALYYFPTSGNYSLHRFNITATLATLNNLLYKQSNLDVTKVTGRVVACNYNAASYDEIVCMYDNSSNVSGGVINYGFYFTSTNNSWKLNNLYTSSAGAHNASFSSYRMAAADFSGDALDDIISFYKFDSATDTNDRGIICMSVAPSLYGYTKKWDPKE